MQISGLHKNIYKLSAYSLRQESLSAAVEARKKQLGDWETLKRRGVPDAEIAAVTGISRATFYRRRAAIKRYGLRGLERRSCRPKRMRTSGIAPSTCDLILSVRTAHPTYGKAKITAIIKRDNGVTLSESSVGRVLKTLKEAGHIKPYEAIRRAKRRRSFTGHAQRWAYDLRPTQPGDMLQIDHMSVKKNHICFKHFQAWDPITKTVHAEIYGNAKSATAARFLKQLEAALPFPIRSIQVDGGSEFMRDFEQACEHRNIPLYVLPPKRPQYNGGVERANRTFREDLYATDMHADSIGAFRFQLKQALIVYNTYRPHQRLDNLTPHHYTQNILMAKMSHFL